MIDEGYTKYECEWQVAPALPVAVIAELNACRNRLYEQGLIGYYPDGVPKVKLHLNPGKATDQPHHSGSGRETAARPAAANRRPSITVLSGSDLGIPWRLQ